jgi:hypothetical protein
MSDSLQCWWYGLDAAWLAALQQQPRHLLDEQRHTTSPFRDAVNDLVG